MKTNLFKFSILKTGFFAVTLVMAMSVTSCKKDEAKPVDTEEVAKDNNDAKFDDTKKEDDAEFLVFAAGTNLEEVKLAQLAQTQGTLADVKELGKMMETAHKKAQSDLEGLATKKTITVPMAITEDGQEAYTKLMEKKGNDFDKAYADMMVDGHKKAIEKFEKASTEAVDPDVKAWATTMLPDLRTHLQHAEMVKAKTDKLK